MDHETKLERLRELGDLQTECAQKAIYWRTKDRPDLALRFERAAYYGANARTFIQAALMAERENVA